MPRMGQLQLAPSNPLFASSRAIFPPQLAKRVLAFVPSFRLCALPGSVCSVLPCFLRPVPSARHIPRRQPALRPCVHAWKGRIMNTWELPSRLMVWNSAPQHAHRTPTGTFRFRASDTTNWGRSLPSRFTGFQPDDGPTTLASDRLLITAADTKDVQRAGAAHNLAHCRRPHT